MPEQWEDNFGIRQLIERLCCQLCACHDSDHHLQSPMSRVCRVSKYVNTVSVAQMVDPAAADQPLTTASSVAETYR